MITQHYTGKKKKLPKIPTKEQLLRIIKEVKDPSVMMGIFLGLFLGFRISEGTYDCKRGNTPLKWEDVDLERGEVTILDAKNPKRYKSGYGKDRIVPIFDHFLHVFKLWKGLHPDSEWVLPDRKDAKKPMKTGYLQRRTHLAIERAGLQSIDYYQTNGNARYKYSFHTFRHCCGTNILRRGMTLEEVKEFLGHESIESTMIYVKIMKDDLKEAVTHAYAYPKKRKYFLDIKQPNMDMQMGIEALRLENENLKMKMQLQQPVMVIPQ